MGLNFMTEEFDKILREHEISPATLQYQLTREEFLYLYFYSEGSTDIQIGMYLNRKKSYLYNLQKHLVKKFKAKNFKQVMYLYGKCS